MKSYQLTFEAIGTRWVIDVSGADLPDKLKLLQNITQNIEKFDVLYSRFRKDSLVTRMAHTTGNYEIPSEGIELLQFYKKLYDLSDGLVTPLIGSVLEESGYDASYSLHSRILHSPGNWEDAIEFNNSTITINKPTLLDLGAAGKGCMIDNISKLMSDSGISEFCIDAGGDIIYKSALKKSIRVGLEHPANPQEVIGAASITNESICASAGNRRKWGNFHHIMNPKTLKPQNNVLSTWVIADSAMLADGLATALFFVDPTILEKEFNFKYIVLYPNLAVAKSPDIKVEFY